jgi:hypothetical protein
MRKKSFCTKGYAEIHIQRPFFDIEKDIWKILVLKIQIVCTCFGVPSTHGNQNLNFWWNFKVSWTNYLWADFASLAVVGSMPELWLKSLKTHNFWTVNSNITCNNSLESYYPPLSTFQVSSALEYYCICSSLSKTEKIQFVLHCCLGVNKSLWLHR